MAVSPSSTTSKLHVSVAPSKSGVKGGTLSRRPSQSRPKKKGCFWKSSAPSRPSRTSGGHSSPWMRFRASSGTPVSASGRDRCSCSGGRGTESRPGCPGETEGSWGLHSPCSAQSCHRSQPWSLRRRASAHRTFHRQTRPVPTSHTPAHSCLSRIHCSQPAGSRGTSSPGSPQQPETAPAWTKPQLGSSPPLLATPPIISLSPYSLTPTQDSFLPPPHTHTLHPLVPGGPSCPAAGALTHRPISP